MKPDLDTRQQILIPERAFRAVQVESIEAAHSVRLTHVEFREVGHVTGEAGCALCQVVAQMTRLFIEMRERARANINMTLQYCCSCGVLHMLFTLI